MAPGGSIAAPEQLKILYVFSLFHSPLMSLVLLHPFIQSVLNAKSLLSAGFVVGVMTLVCNFFLGKVALLVFGNL